MNRSDLQRLSNARIRETKILFDAGEFSGAYYLAGYSVECALKACFAKRVKRYDFPDRKVGNIFIHDLKVLVRLANLSAELADAEKASSKFTSGWNVVCKWDETSRYLTWTKDDAEAMLDAIVRRKDGVLPWIRRRW